VAASYQIGIDPQGFIHADRLERQVLAEIANQAIEHYTKRRQAEIEAIGNAVGNAIGKVFSKKK
jgi:hypothetical protein